MIRQEEEAELPLFSFPLFRGIRILGNEKEPDMPFMARAGGSKHFLFFTANHCVCVSLRDGFQTGPPLACPHPFHSQE